MGSAPLEALSKASVATVPEHLRPLSSAGVCEGHSAFATSFVAPCSAIINGGHMPLFERMHSAAELVSFELLQGATFSIVDLPGSLLRDGLRETWAEENTG